MALGGRAHTRSDRVVDVPAVTWAAMQLIVVDPAKPPRAVPPAPIHVDTSDSVALAWLDLDRSETLELPRLVPELPAPVARDLRDSTSTPQLRERGTLSWLSLLAVRDAAGGKELADLDVLFAPGLLVTVHSGERSAIEDLRDPARWRRRLAPPLSRTALEILIYAMLDGYDDFIDETEDEIGQLQDGSVTLDRRAVVAKLLQHRRQMMAVRGQLNGQRELFADLAQSGNTTQTDRSWLINRLDAAIAGAREAADYALAATLYLHTASRRRGRELELVLATAWSTWLGLLVITRLASTGGPSAMDPFVYLGALLVVITVLVLAMAASRRWL